MKEEIKGSEKLKEAGKTPEKPKEEVKIPEKPLEEAKAPIVEKPKEEPKPSAPPTIVETKPAATSEQPKDDPKPPVDPKPAPVPVVEKPKEQPAEKPQGEPHISDRPKAYVADSPPVPAPTDQSVSLPGKLPTVEAKPAPEVSKVEAVASTESHKREPLSEGGKHTEEAEGTGKAGDVESPVPAKHDLPRKEVPTRPTEIKPEDNSSGSLLYVLLGVAGAAAVGLFWYMSYIRKAA